MIGTFSRKQASTSNRLQGFIYYTHFLPFGKVQSYLRIMSASTRAAFTLFERTPGSSMNVTEGTILPSIGSSSRVRIVFDFFGPVPGPDEQLSLHFINNRLQVWSAITPSFFSLLICYMPRVPSPWPSFHGYKVQRTSFCPASRCAPLSSG